MNTFGNGSIWHAGANYRLGDTLLVVQGGMTHASASNMGMLILPHSFPASGTKSFTVGVIHSLSRRTTMFGGFQHVVPNGRLAWELIAREDTRSAWTVGMRHNF